MSGLEPRLPLRVRLAGRNLWRNPRRTLLTLAAMAFATALLILFYGIEEGFLQQAVRSATGATLGDAKVTAPGYLDRHALELTVPQAGLRAKILADRTVVGAAGRVRGYALLTVGNGPAARSEPAEVLGVDPTEEKGVSRFLSALTEGRTLPGATGDGVLLGSGLALKLHAHPGDEVVLMGQQVDGTVAAGILHVAGIVRTGDDLQDRMLAVAGRRTVQGLFGLDGQLHEVTVALTSPFEAAGWAKRVQAKLPGTGVTPWTVLVPQVASMIGMVGAAETILGVFFYFAVLMVCINTITMALVERRHEFAVLAALGFKPRAVRQLILLEGAFLGVLAGLVGGVAGAAVSTWVHGHPIPLATSSIAFSGFAIEPVLRTAPSMRNVLVPVVVTAVLGTAVAGFAGRRISRRRPADALRQV